MEMQHQTLEQMSNKKIECLEKSEVEWASRVCDSITDRKGKI